MFAPDPSPRAGSQPEPTPFAGGEVLIRTRNGAALLRLKATLVRLLLVIPAIILGGVLRSARMTEVMSSARMFPDYDGYVALARTGLQFYYGWREPLLPFLVSLLRAATGGTPEAALDEIVYVSSLLSLVGTWFIGRRLVGDGAALIALYLTATSPLHLSTLWYRERIDLHLVLLLVCWLAIVERRWILLGIVTGVGMYLRLSTLATMFSTVAVLFLTTRDFRSLQHGERLRFLGGTALLTVIGFPLLWYYYRTFGDPLYVERIALADYLKHARDGKWLVDVTGNFDRNYLSSVLRYGDLFADSLSWADALGRGFLRFTAPALEGVAGQGVIVVPHLLFLSGYWAGVVKAFTGDRDAKVGVAILLGQTLPLLPLSVFPELSERYFVPSQTIVFLISGCGIAWMLRFAATCLGTSAAARATKRRLV